MNERKFRALDQLRADQAAIRAAAERVRGEPVNGPAAGLADPRVATACGELLDVLADDLAAMPAQVRQHTARVSRELIGTPMDQPTRRRTRRR